MIKKIYIFLPSSHPRSLTNTSQSFVQEVYTANVPRRRAAVIFAFYISIFVQQKPRK